MRYWLGLALAALTVNAGASNWREPVELPAGRLPVAVPGFVFQAPGGGWLMTNDLPPKNGLISATGRTRFFFPKESEAAKADPAASFATLGMGDEHWLDDRIATQEAFDRAAKAAFDAESGSVRNLDPNAKAEFTLGALNGAHCAGWRITSEQNGAVDGIGAPRQVIAALRSCIHPGKPGFRLTLRYGAGWDKGTELAPGALEGLAALDTIALTSSPFRPQAVALPGSITRMAEGAGAIWLSYADTDAKNALHRGGVVRIDPITNAIVATIPLSGRPSIMAPAPDGLWVATGARLIRIDSTTNKIAATITQRQNVFALVAGGGYLWALSHDVPDGREKGTKVLRINPASGAADEIQQPGGAPRDIFFADGALYIAVDKALMRVDPASLTLTGSSPLEPGRLHWDGQALWNLVTTDSFVPARLDPEAYRRIPKPFVVKLDRIDLKAPQEPPVTVTRYMGTAMLPPSGYAWWNGRFCMLAEDAAICIDPDAPVAPAEVIACGRGWSGDIAVVNGSLWVARMLGRAAIRLDRE